MRIDPKDITFVIQGPLGTTVDKKTLRVEGVETNTRVIPEKALPKSIANIRRLFPQAHILLSTWEGQDDSGLDYDEILFSKDPGPNITRFEKDDSPAYENMNRQIVSTLSGLRRVKTKYAIKLRSDNILHSNKVLDYIEKYPCRSNSYRILNQGIVTSNMWAQEYAGGFPMPFFVSDFFHFGTTEDLINLWDVPLAEDYKYRSSLSGHRQYLEYPFPRICVEQKLFSQFLAKHLDLNLRHKHDIFRGNKTLSDHCIANNLVIVEAEDLGLEVLERNRQGIDKAGRFYSHIRWQQLYKRYCDPSYESEHLPNFKKSYYKSRIVLFLKLGLKTCFRLVRCKIQNQFVKHAN